MHAGDFVSLRKQLQCLKRLGASHVHVHTSANKVSKTLLSRPMLKRSDQSYSELKTLPMNPVRMVLAYQCCLCSRWCG